MGWVYILGEIIVSNEELLNELKSRFPGIDQADEEMDGADTVDSLVQWFAELGGVFSQPSDDEPEEESDMERDRR